MMKLGTIIPYLENIQKIYKSHDTLLELCWNQHFFTENQQILLYQEISMYSAFWYIISYSFNFFESLKIFLINMAAILMMSAKTATLGLLRIKVFWNKIYDVIVCIYDLSNKFLSRDWNYIVDVVMWPKFGNSSTLMKKVITTSIL